MKKRTERVRTMIEAADIEAGFIAGKIEIRIYAERR